MRDLAIALALAATLSFYTGCTGAHDCKRGTVLLAIDGAVSADTIHVHFAVSGGPSADGEKPLNGRSGGTVEIDFATYPAGQSVSWDISALQGGQTLASSQGSTTLSPGCTLIRVHLGADTDLGASDLAAGDAAVKAQGAACKPGDQCAGGTTCVDGFCCDVPCTGSCGACNVPGHEGACWRIQGAPVSPHPACLGDTSGLCAGSCDGTSTDCKYPNVQCAPASCTGAITTVGRGCAGGTCQPAALSPITCSPAICDDTQCATSPEVSASFQTACAVISDGSVMCWGDNSYGGVGISPSPGGPLPPTRVPGLSLPAVQAVQGGGWGCALLTDRTVQCWGANQLGQLGIGSIDAAVGFHPPTTVLVSAGHALTNVDKLATSTSYTCALTTSSGVYCWGYTEAITSGLFGGSGSNSLYASPICARGSTNTSCPIASDVLEIAPATGHACYRAVGGFVACWGNNYNGDCGQPGGAVNQPTTIAGLSANHIAAGAAVSCAVLGDGSGKILCWGDNNNGMLGLGITDASPHPTPSPVCADASCLTSLGNINAIGVGGAHVCAISGALPVCWGRNDHGQLLTGDRNDRFYTVQPSGSAQGSQISSGDRFSCMTSPTGAVLCWGADNIDQIGDGDTADKLTATAPLLGR